jgi:hypothetical protein
MALKITISNAQDVQDFFEMMIAGHESIEFLLNDLLDKRTQQLNEQLERREYAINRERSVMAAEDALNIKHKKVA